MKKKITTRKIYYFAFIAFILIAGAVYFAGRSLLNKEVLKHSISEKPLPNSKWSYFINFESNDFLYSTDMLTKDIALSGLYSSGFCEITNLSAAIDIPLPTNDSTELNEVNIKLWFYSKANKMNASMVFSIFDQKGNQTYWTSRGMIFDEVQPEIWTPSNFSFKVPGIYVDSRNFVRIYVWNHNRMEKPFYVDDITLAFNEMPAFDKPKTFLFDFEDVSDYKISSKHAKQGFYSTFAKGPDGFSVNASISLAKLKSDNLQSIQYRFYVLSESPEVDAVLAATIVDEHNTELLWRGTLINSDDFVTNQWQSFNGEVFIPDELLNDNHSLRFYLWNKAKTTVYLDNIYIVVKEKGFLDTEDLSFWDMTLNQEHIETANQPPYQTKFIFNNQFIDDAELCSMLSGNNSIMLTGNFIEKLPTDQILHISPKGKFIVYFADKRIIKQKVRFKPDFSAGRLFADQNQIIHYDDVQNSLAVYQFDNQKRAFLQIAKKQNLRLNNLSNVFVFNKNIISALDNSGKIHNFKINNNEIIAQNSKQLVSIAENNIKAFAGKFINSTRLLLLTYINNGQHKYEIFRLNPDNNSWSHYPGHANLSTQGYDQLSFFNSYFPVNVCNNSAKDMMLMLDKSSKFDLKLVEFNKLGYKILYNIDFSGFDAGQNPKFYENHKIIKGNFIDNGNTDIIIFQTNKSKVKGFSPKTEIYSFEQVN